MEVTLDRAKEIAMPILKSKFPVLFRSKHGIGKSEVFYQMAREMGFDESQIVERRLSQMSEGEMIGLPVVNGDVTKYNPMNWYKKCCTEKCFLFFDEIDRASDDNRQAVFQIMDSRTFNGWKLHPDTVVVAAINGGSHGSNYRVRTMDPAELSRYAVIDIEPDPQVWLNWARSSKKILDPICDFISQNPSMLNHRGVYEPNKVYPCSRSWTRFNKVLSENKMLEGDSIPESVVLIGYTFIGDIAPAFYSHLNNTFVKYDIDDLLAGKYNKQLTEPRFQVRGISALLEKIPYSDKLSDYKAPKAFSKKELDNFVNFAKAIVSNEQFLVLLKQIPTTFIKFGQECEDFAKYYDNTFAHNLFTHETTDESGTKMQFHTYITNRLEKIFSDDESTKNMEEFIKGMQNDESKSE